MTDFPLTAPDLEAISRVLGWTAGLTGPFDRDMVAALAEVAMKASRHLRSLQSPEPRLHLVVDAGGAVLEQRSTREDAFHRALALFRWSSIDGRGQLPGVIQFKWDDGSTQGWVISLPALLESGWPAPSPLDEPPPPPPHRGIQPSEPWPRPQ